MIRGVDPVISVFLTVAAVVVLGLVAPHLGGDERTPGPRRRQ